ncbi:MAG: hypothetical protein ABSH28_13930 [Acidobacteriota bacterium]|jgi:hypothetical protein
MTRFMVGTTLALLVTLKLTHVIAWSWLWILSPLWIYVILWVLGIFVISTFLAVVMGVVSSHATARRRHFR